MGAARDRIWTFAERCSKARSVEDVACAFLAETASLGFAHVALCSHVDPIRPPEGAVAVFRYPLEWLRHFSEEGYQDIDPVFLEANRREAPFRWDDPAFLSGLNERQRQILVEGAEVGLADGFTVPLRISGALPASCSLVAGEDGVDPLNYPVAHAIAVFAHENARRLAGDSGSTSAPLLSNRERECLTLVARGKSDWSISRILNLSEHTVHNAVQRAMRRLGVSSRAQAVARALLSGQISPSEVTD